MSKGARLALLLHGELLDEDHAAWNLLERHQKPLFSRQAFAFISLVGPDGLVRPVNFFPPQVPIQEHRIALGQEATSGLLRSGNHRLRVEMPGGRVVEEDILLIDGETTRIQLELP